MDENIIAKIEEDDQRYHSNEISNKYDKPNKPSLSEIDMAVEKIFMENMETLLKFEDNTICYSSNGSLNHSGTVSLDAENQEIERMDLANEDLHDNLRNINVDNSSSSILKERERPRTHEILSVPDEIIFDDTKVVVNLGQDNNGNILDETSNKHDKVTICDSSKTTPVVYESSFSDENVFTNHLLSCEKKQHEIVTSLPAMLAYVENNPKDGSTKMGFGNPYKCDICGKTFKRKVHKKHLLFCEEKQSDIAISKLTFVENNPKDGPTKMGFGNPYKCDICGKTFKRRVYKNHLLYCEKKRCRKAIELPSRSIYSQHQHKESKSRGNQFKNHRKDNISEKETTVTSELPQCSRMREKAYKCDVCAKRFSLHQGLKVHLRTHTRVKPYKCDLCEKRFCQLSNVQSHLRIHTGEKPYKCYICGKDFCQLSHLQTHLRVHAGQRPYKCDICGKGFNQKSNLQKHLPMHSGKICK